jgi:hypothetical protein
MPAAVMMQPLILKIVTGPLQKPVLTRLSSTILSEGEVFTMALRATAGKFNGDLHLGSLLEYFQGSCKVLQWEQNARIYE